MGVKSFVKGVAKRTPVGAAVTAGSRLAKGDVKGAVGAVTGVGAVGAIKDAAYDKIKSALPEVPSVDDVVKGAGLNAADTSTLEKDVATVRTRRDSLGQQLDTFQPGQAPTVTKTTVGPAATAGGVSVAPAAQVQKTTVAPAPTIAPTTVARTGDVVAERIAAPTIAATPNAVAGTVQAAQVQRVGPVQAATIAPVATATAAPVTAARVDGTLQGEVRNDIRALTSETREIAAGRGGPSAAELLLQKNAEDARRRALGFASARARGGDAGLALREAMIVGDDAQAKAGQEAAILRAQEQEKARERLGSLLSGTREQDIGLATTNAGFQQQAGITGAQLGTQVNLANAGAENTRGLKLADLEQEARQRAAEREQAANLKQADLTTSAATTTAELGTRTSISNADRDAARALKQGDLDLDAAKSNQSTTLSAATTNKEIGSRENLAQAEIEARARIQDAQGKLAVLLEQAKLDQQAGIVNAQLTTDIQKLQATIDSETQRFNAGETNKLTTTQADITSRESIADSDATLRQRGIDQARESTLRSDTLRADEIAAIQERERLALLEKEKDRKAMIAAAGLGAAAQAAGPLAALFSDPDKKKNLSRLMDGEQIDDFLDALEAKRFEYKDPDAPGAAPGKRVGITTDDLKKSAVGRSLVRDTPQGEMVDVPQAVGVLLASMAQMRKDLKKRRAA